MTLPVVNWSFTPVSFDLKNSFTLAKKSVHLVLKGLQVLFSGQFADFLCLC